MTLTSMNKPQMQVMGLHLQRTGWEALRIRPVSCPRTAPSKGMGAIMTPGKDTLAADKRTAVHTNT